MMLRLALVLVMVALLTGARTAEAQYLSGNELQKYCEDRNEHLKSICLGYIIGAADALIAEMRHRGQDYSGWRACIPDRVNPIQLRDVVMKWIEQYPQFRHTSGESIVRAALSLNFPCDASQQKSSESAPAIALNPNQIHDVQTRLQTLGYYSGPVDGVMGPRTRRAVTDFQRAKGLNTTGEVDWETLQLLFQ